MGKAQSKSEIPTEERNYKPDNEHCKDDCQEGYAMDDRQKEDGTDDSQEEDDTYDSHEEDGTDDRCNKTDEESLFYGTHETQEVSEGGGVGLPKYLDSFKKNPGHKMFVPVDDFNINHLPKGHHDNDLVEVIKATADLTVRVGVKRVSTERPEFWPNTNQPYPFYDKRGSDVMMLGTGVVTYVNKWTEECIKKNNMGTCPCHKCQHSDTPSKVWADVWMNTATHVVFDDLEARHTTCRLFFDGQDSPLVTLDGWTVERANIEEDRCVLKCVTCDVDLLDKLDKMWWYWNGLRRKEVYKRNKSSRDKVKLTFIVSHPHGCPKQISVGHRINMCEVIDLRQETQMEIAQQKSGIIRETENLKPNNGKILKSCHEHKDPTSARHLLNNVQEVSDDYLGNNANPPPARNYTGAATLHQTTRYDLSGNNCMRPKFN